MLHLSPALAILKISFHTHGRDFVKNKIEYDKIELMKSALKTTEKARNVIYNSAKLYNEEELLTLPNFESLTDQIKKKRDAKKIIKQVEPSDIPSYIKKNWEG